MIVTKKTIPRRTVLRGFGAALGLPLLDAMIPAFSATVKTAAKPVNRFQAIYLPNGMAMDTGRRRPRGRRSSSLPF